LKLAVNNCLKKLTKTRRPIISLAENYRSRQPLNKRIAKNGI